MADTPSSNQMPELPGYYFDVDRNRYFKIDSNPSSYDIQRQAVSSVENSNLNTRRVYSSAEIKSEKRNAALSASLRKEINLQYKNTRKGKYVHRNKLPWSELITNIELGRDIIKSNKRNKKELYKGLGLSNPNLLITEKLRNAKHLNFKNNELNIGSNDYDINSFYSHAKFPIFIMATESKEIVVCIYSVFIDSKTNEISDWSFYPILNVPTDSQFPINSVFFSNEYLDINSNTIIDIGYSTINHCTPKLISITLDFVNYITEIDHKLIKNYTILDSNDSIKLDKHDIFSVELLDSHSARRSFTGGLILGFNRKLYIKIFKGNNILHDKILSVDSRKYKDKDNKKHYSMSWDIVLTKTMHYNDYLLLIIFFRCGELALLKFTLYNGDVSLRYLGKISSNSTLIAKFAECDYAIMRSSAGNELPIVVLFSSGYFIPYIISDPLMKNNRTSVRKDDHYEVKWTNGYENFNVHPAVFSFHPLLLVYVDPTHFLRYYIPFSNKHKNIPASPYIIDLNKEQEILSCVNSSTYLAHHGRQDIHKIVNNIFISQCPFIKGLEYRAGSHTYIFTIIPVNGKFKINLWCI